MSSWIYKCNSRNHPHQVAFGDWNDFFSGATTGEWGSTEWVPALRKLKKGDRVLAYQTDRNELVGVATVVGQSKRGKHYTVNLRRGEKLGVKVRPLKVANPEIERIAALGPGPIQTIYQVRAGEYDALLRAAKRDIRHRKTSVASKSTSVSHESTPRVWRMAMRCGNQGPNLWPDCFRKGVAAITYGAIQKIDLRNSRAAALALSKLQPAQRGFINAFLHKMRIGDTIFVKDAKRVVGKGTITGEYRFDRRGTIVAPDFPDSPFVHLRRVNWDEDFTPVTIDLGANQSTILELKGSRLHELESAIARTATANHTALKDGIGTRYFQEGGTREIVAEIGNRSNALREHALRSLPTQCEVCRFDFYKVYGELGEGFAEVHHLKEVSSQKGRRVRTSLKGVAILCANCHRMLHRNGAKPLPISTLRAIVRGNNGMH